MNKKIAYEECLKELGISHNEKCEIQAWFSDKTYEGRVIGANFGFSSDSGAKVLICAIDDPMVFDQSIFDKTVLEEDYDYIPDGTIINDRFILKPIELIAKL